MTDPHLIQRIRLHLDGELNAQESAELERQIAQSPALRNFAQGERRMKERVRGVMNAAAPSGLAAQVRTALSRANAPDGALQARSAANTRPRRTASSLGHRLVASLTAPRQVNVYAVAACLLLVAGVVLVGIFGTSIDRVAPRHADTIITDVMEFVTNEHGRCVGSEIAVRERAQARTPQAAVALLAEHLGAQIRVPDLSPVGYEFVGAGPCNVPGSDRSAHMIYQRQLPTGQMTVLSLFLMPDAGQFELLQGQLVPIDPCEDIGQMWSDGSMIYLVVVTDRNDLSAAMPLLRKKCAGDHDKLRR